MENRDAQQNAQAPQLDPLGLQQQVAYLHQQLQVQQQMFLQQQQYLIFQQQHPAQQAGGLRAEPHKVKLPPLWTTQAMSWFQLAESQFAIYAVDDPWLRFNITLAALSDETRLHAKAIVEAPDAYRDPYRALKARIMEVYQPSTWKLAAEFLKVEGLGARRPLDMMDEILVLLPPNGDLSLLVKASFLGRLPANMRDHVQEGAELLSYQQLAARADTIWDERHADKPPAVIFSLWRLNTKTTECPQDRVFIFPPAYSTVLH